MKKSALVLALALALTFAFAASAFANPAGYITWDEGYNTAITGLTNDSPHANYQLNTQKCQVCHAAHNATPGGELLLRSSAADACTFCHIDEGITGLVQVYNGIEDNYTMAGTWGHNTGNYNSCTGCHAVHSANTFTNGEISSLILRDLSDSVDTVGAWTGANHVANAPAAYAASGDRQEAITYFCTQCHKYYRDGSADAFGNLNTEMNVEYVGFVEKYGLNTRASHPMVADNTFDYTDGGGRGADVVTSAEVAYAGSTTCRACHDSGTDGADALVDGGAEGTLGSAFPHYTPGNEMLDAATDSNDTPVAAVSGDNDGVCLKCHSNGVSGVSMSF